MVKRKRSMRVNMYIFFLFRVDLWVGTPVDELKGLCVGYAEK